MLMKQLHMNQSELAKFVDINSGRLSQMLNGKQCPKMRFFRQFRQHIPMDDLFYTNLLEVFVELVA